MENPQKTAAKLAEVLDVTPPRSSCEPLTAETGFEYLARRSTSSTADRVRKLELAGIGILPDSRRVYPQGETARG